MHTSHVVVGLSGGVDSSVAAYLLKKAGYQVEGIFMKNWQEDDTDEYCPAEADLADAKAIADQLGIGFTAVNFADHYWEHVFSYFLDEYRLGRTPNPDILCNKEIKFKAFLAYARKRGADYIATGHYVRTREMPDGLRLQKGADPHKDQSYFLHTLDQSQLAQSLFPVGHLCKQSVRSLAKQLGFGNHAKKDSTGICFIGERKFKAFLSEYLPAQRGQIETAEGEIVGEHDGVMFYTVGQRQGLRIGGRKGQAEAPWYVADKDISRNVLIVVQGDNHPALFKQTLTATQIQWINDVPAIPCSLNAKIRYRQIDQACTIEEWSDQHCRVVFAQPQRAITPGQSIVFYQDDICLGGGIIQS